MHPQLAHASDQSEAENEDLLRDYFRDPQDVIDDPDRFAAVRRLAGDPLLIAKISHEKRVELQAKHQPRLTEIQRELESAVDVLFNSGFRELLGDLARQSFFERIERLVEVSTEIDDESVRREIGESVASNQKKWLELSNIIQENRDATIECAAKFRSLRSERRKIESEIQNQIASVDMAIKLLIAKEGDRRIIEHNLAELGIARAGVAASGTIRGKGFGDEGALLEWFRANAVELELLNISATDAVERLEKLLLPGKIATADVIERLLGDKAIQDYLIACKAVVISDAHAAAAEGRTAEQIINELEIKPEPRAMTDEELDEYLMKFAGPGPVLGVGQAERSPDELPAIPTSVDRMQAEHDDETPAGERIDSIGLAQKVSAQVEHDLREAAQNASDGSITSLEEAEEALRKLRAMGDED